MTLLWYVHHHGSGHWRRGLAVAALCERPIVFASTRPPAWPLPRWASYLPLPADVPVSSEYDGNPTANGQLHWAPALQAGLLERHALLLAAARHASHAVVDLSVEVAVLLRVSGIPVTLVRLPGKREDGPHRLASALADRLVMPVPANWQLAPEGVEPLGLVSMLTRAGPGADPEGPVLVVGGTGGGGLPESSLRMLESATVRQVIVAEGERDIGSLLASASIVVGGAGLGTVADVAAAGRPFIALPADRPFGEQAATAAAMSRHEGTVTASAAPDTVGEWRSLLALALDSGPLRADTGGASRFAERLLAA